jgi:hypothetical protein
MYAETLGPSPTPAPQARRTLPRWVRDVAVVLIAIAAGFSSSYLHPGPRGLRGPQGPQGIQGYAGLPGNDASAQHLGVCVSSYTFNSGYTNWPALLSDLTITSPSRGNDGTVSCGAGNFVPVAPQRP